MKTGWSIGYILCIYYGENKLFNVFLSDDNDVGFELNQQA